MRLKILTVSSLVMIFICISSAPAAKAQSYLSQADELFKQRGNMALAIQSAAFYRRAAAAEPDNPEAFWKLARSLCWIAEHQRGQSRLHAAKEAVEAAKRAVALAPHEAAAHFFLAMSYGYYGFSLGIIGGVIYVKPALNSIHRAIALDPGYENGAAYLALGRAYYFLPAAFGGGLQKAIDHYNTALQYGPRLWGAHLFLAEAYIKEGRTKEARTLLDQILAGPPEPGYEAEYKEWKGEAEYWLDKLNKAKK